MEDGVALLDGPVCHEGLDIVYSSFVNDFKSHTAFIDDTFAIKAQGVERLTCACKSECEFKTLVG